MIRNYLLVALRTLSRNRLQSIISISGLALAMACCLIVGFYVSGQLGHDAFHEKSDRIYRVVRGFHHPGQATSYVPGSGPAVVKEWKESYPEVEEAVRLYFREDGGLWLRSGDRSFKQSFCVADSTIYEVFSFEFIRGSAEGAIRTPNGLVLSRSTAKRMFGDVDPLGRTLTVDDWKLVGEYQVAGVIEDLPATSHFQIEVLTTAFTTDWVRGVLGHYYMWGRDARSVSYVLLREGVAPAVLASKFEDYITDRLPEELKSIASYHLQPIERIHLYSFEDYGFDGWSVGSSAYDLGVSGSISNVRTFIAVALVVLVLASVNFANLSVAQALRRNTEVGLRKVFGAYRSQLMTQFLGESVLTIGLAFFVALALVEGALPTFESFVEKDASILQGNGPLLIAGLLGCLPLVVLLTASYPALILSGSRGPLLSDRSTGGTGRRSGLRRGLVGLQFAITMALMVVTAVVYQQMSFLQDKKLGFDREQVLATHLFRTDYDLIPKYQLVKEAFLSVPGVTGASAVQPLLGRSSGSGRIGLPGEERAMMRRFSVDEDFVGMMGMEIIAGRNLSSIPSGADQAEMVLNESAVKTLGLEEPIGALVQGGFREIQQATVVGVVRDFHAASLHEEISPIFMYKYVDSFRWLYLKVRPEGLAGTLEDVEKVWERFFPDKPFVFTFLDDHLDSLYRTEQRAQRLLFVFVGLAIAISCLGLWSFASYTAFQRRKEIGIRKVLGATSGSVLGLLTGEVVVLLAIAAVVAAPVGYWVAGRWLEDFAYKVDLGVSPFLFATIAAVSVGLLTVTYESLRAAWSDPVTSIRHE